MKTFLVTVRKDGKIYAYSALRECSTDVVNDAIDRFGVCSVFVRAKKCQ